MYRNCASRSGCCLPSSTLALACRLKPLSRNRSPTSGAEIRRPDAVNSAASVLVDFVVHRNGDIGSHHAPTTVPRHPITTAADAHPDAATTPATSPPTTLRSPHPQPYRRPYHTDSRQNGNLRVIFSRALSAGAGPYPCFVLLGRL